MKKKRILICITLLLCTIHVFSQTYVMMARPGKSKKWGFVNEKGEFIIPPRFAKCYPFTEDGVAIVYTTYDANYYFINLKGEKIKTATLYFRLNEGYMDLGLHVFNDGMIQICEGDKWGFLDTEGRMAIRTKYSEVRDFNNGLTTAKRGNEFFVLTKTGEETKINAPGIKAALEFSEGRGIYLTEDKQFGFIDKLGNSVIPAKFIRVGYFKEGVAWVKTASKLVGFIDTTGKWLIEPKFEVAHNFDKESGLARVKLNGIYLYVDKAGNELYLKDTERLGDFSEGLAVGKKNGKEGAFTNKGEWVIEPKFKDMRNFKNGYAAARLGKVWGVVDKKGNWVIPPSYNAALDMELVK